MSELREYTNDEYKVDLRKELEENGLYKSVGKRLDEINTTISELNCIPVTITRHHGYSYAQEMMREIMDLIEMRELLLSLI